MVRHKGVRKGVSLLDVARRAGVSTQTVSRVSNHSPLVSEGTRKSVEKAMRETGYRPNYAARALKRGSFRSLGIEMFNIRTTGNMDLLQSLTQSASEHGYSVTLQMLDPSARTTLSRIDASVERQAVDGAILLMEHMLPDFRTFRPGRVPLTAITSVPGSRIDTVDADQAMGARLAVESLLAHGHRNVWFVSGPENSVAGRVREESWKRTLLDHGITPPPIPPACHGDWTPGSGYRAGLALARIPGCTAVYAANDYMANGVIAALQDCGKSVPEDVSVIGVDDSLKVSSPRVTLTTVRQNWSEVAARAVSLTIAAIRSANADAGMGPDEESDPDGEAMAAAAAPSAASRAPHHELIPCTLVERESVAAPPSAQ